MFQLFCLYNIICNGLATVYLFQLLATTEDVVYGYVKFLIEFEMSNGKC